MNLFKALFGRRSTQPTPILPPTPTHVPSNPNPGAPEGESQGVLMLHIAIITGDRCGLDMLTELNPVNINIPHKDDSGTALHRAASFCDDAMVELLLARGADVGVMNAHGVLAIENAVTCGGGRDDRGGLVRTLELLIAAGSPLGRAAGFAKHKADGIARGVFERAQPAETARARAPTPAQGCQSCGRRMEPGSARKSLELMQSGETERLLAMKTVCRSCGAIQCTGCAHSAGGKCPSCGGEVEASG